jgi:hypothetical protein
LGQFGWFLERGNRLVLSRGILHLCYGNSEVEEFDLLIDNQELAVAVISRLEELGVRVIIRDGVGTPLISSAN